MTWIITLAWIVANAVAVIMLCKALAVRYKKSYVILIHAIAAIVILGAQLIYAHHHSPWLGVMLGMLTMLVGNAIVLQVIVANSKKEDAEDELLGLQRIHSLEQAHYSAIETQRYELTKIRHDFNSQLAAAHHLIATDKSEHAVKLLDALKQRIAHTKERPYCPNVIVNAVLTEKQRDCDAADIILDTDIAIDESCEIAAIHLCSIFSNLLDNAIRACKTLKQERRVIALRSFVKGEYMHIRCENPVADMPEKNPGRKGHGKVILSDIASHYRGNFTAKIVDDKHIAVVSVLSR